MRSLSSPIRLSFGLLLLCQVRCLNAGSDARRPADRVFPDDFQFGASTSSFQCEGAATEDGRGESIWDRALRELTFFENFPANLFPDSYQRYKEDVQLLKATGVDFYRFSISWPRIMPNGDISSLNELGLRYYDNLIDELLLHNIEPVVTIYHWDLPQALQELGGLTNADIVPYIEQFAEVLFDRYADRVRTWQTFNEPYLICYFGYELGFIAPYVRAKGLGQYACNHNLLVANAKIYDLYDQRHRRDGGQIGLTTVIPFFWPDNAQNASHVAATERAIQFMVGLILHPIFIGDYPPVIVDQVDRKSRQEGRRWSRLPRMSNDTRQLIKGKADFIGVNYYQSFMVTPTEERLNGVSAPTIFSDYDLEIHKADAWPKPRDGHEWLFSSPNGLRSMLNWLRTEYNNPELKIMENGWPDAELNDTDRIGYLKAHMNEVLDAIGDGCNVTTYGVWSLLDTFEWGMSVPSDRFGLYHVNFSDPQRTRTARASVGFLRNVIESRRVPSD